MTNHLWQSTVYALLAALATLAFRRNRAQVRYWLWFSASMKFFIPLAVLIGLGSRLEWKPAAHPFAPQEVSQALEEVTEPFPEAAPLASARPGARNWIPFAIFAIWTAGFAAIAILRLRGWVRVQAAVRASLPLEIPASVQVRASPGLLEPGVVGCLRPILLVPEGIADCLTPQQLEAVLAHELCHVRRRDNLTSAIHMLVEAIFWFHPLVWWIGARLLEEREKACDEGVLSLGSEPQVYAEAIVNVCKLYVESPLACVSGVTGADLKQRIEAILSNRMVFRLTLAQKAALATAALVAAAVPIVVGIVRAQEPTTILAFEVASIKPCAPGDFPAGKGGGARGGGGGPGGPQGPSPDRLNLACQPIKNLIRMAYQLFPEGHRVPPGPFPPIEGGPGWIDSERYKVDAKAEGTPGQEMMRGPMLQALLEDRLKLKVHHQAKEVPVYNLTVAKNGPKLKPAQEADCISFEAFDAMVRSGPPEKLPPICGMRMLNH